MATVSDKSVWARFALRRLSEGVCRRAFSSPEAFLYELTIAEALSRVVLPVLKPNLRGRCVLDVGAGGGRLALALADDHLVTGVDPSWAQVRRFDRRARGRAATACADGEFLPLQSAAFDTVYSSCVFKHWPDPREPLREAARVARSGGSLITIEIDGAASADDFRRFADRSRVPIGLRSAYVRFAMRTVVGVAPTLEDLGDAFNGVAVADLTVDRFADMPF